MLSTAGVVYPAVGEDLAMHIRGLGLSLLTLFLCLAVGGPGASAKRKKTAQPTADEILERATRLLSGEAGAAPVVVRFHGHLEIMDQPAMAMSARMVVGEWAYFRSVATTGFAMDMGILGDVGWEVASNRRPTLLHDQDLLAVRGMMLPETSVDIREHYPTRKTLGTATFQGVEAYKVRLVDRDGAVKTSFFAVDSGLPLAEKGVASLGIGPMPFSISYSDYREVDGAQIAHEVLVVVETARTKMTISEFFIEGDDTTPPPLPLPIQALVVLEDQEEEGSGERAVAYTAVVPPDAAAVRFELGEAGGVVPGMGDLDGDGTTELAFAIPTAGEPRADRILVFDGPFAGEVGPDDAFARILGGGANLAAERPLAIADLDGDGVDDLAALWDLGDDGASLCLVHGPLDAGESGTDACDAWFTLPPGTDISAGCVHADGDLTGDGLEDLLVGIPGADQVLVLPGKTDRYTGTAMLAAAAVVQLGGDGAFGARFAVADGDGDGAPDLWIAAPERDTPRADAGAVHLYRGPVGADSATSGATYSLHAGLSRTHAGVDLDAGGDLDGDGDRELLVLAAHPELGGDAVLLEPWPAVAERELSWMMTRIAAVAVDDPIRRVRTAGDVDGDGFADVLLGVPGADDLAGRAYLVYGPLTHAMTLTEASVLFRSPGAGRHFGTDLLPVGDMNEDGRDDLLIVAVNAPAAYLYLGAPRPEPPEDHPQAGDQTAP